jgi:hypothetical protein
MLVATPSDNEMQMLMRNNYEFGRIRFELDENHQPKRRILEARRSTTEPWEQIVAKKITVEQVDSGCEVVDDDD